MWKLSRVTFYFKSFTMTNIINRRTDSNCRITDFYSPSLALSLFLPSKGLQFKSGKLNEHGVHCHWICLSRIKSVLWMHQENERKKTIKNRLDDTYIEDAFEASAWRIIIIIIGRDWRLEHTRLREQCEKCHQDHENTYAWNIRPEKDVVKE